MTRDELLEMVDAALRVGDSVESVSTSLSALDRIVAWCEMQRVTCARALEQAGAMAHDVIAKVSRVPIRETDRIIHRSETLKSAPGFGDALAAGDVSVRHVDVLDRAVRQLAPDAQKKLLDQTDQMLAQATTLSAEDFGRDVRRRMRQIDTGEATFERQQRCVRLRTWIDPEDGMHVWSLRVDPRTGLRLHTALVTMTERLFHDRTPEHCPVDPLERLSFLRGHALVALIEGDGIRLGVPEFVCVIDTTSGAAAASATGGAPSVDWGLPVELPDSVIQQLWPTSNVHGVVVRNGVVIHAPGQLNLGRTTRLANRAQRRALRALYSTCSVPGCSTRFELCHIHHISWWENGGTTDLDNLIPVCNRHHHLIHQHSMHIVTDPHRRITVTHPGGATTTGPPTRGGP